MHYKNGREATNLWSQHLENACVRDCPYCSVHKARLAFVPQAIEFAVEWTIKQLSQREEWPWSWDAGFPSYKASALLAFQARIAALEVADFKNRFGGT